MLNKFRYHGITKSPVLGRVSVRVCVCDSHDHCKHDGCSAECIHLCKRWPQPATLHPDCPCCSEDKAVMTPWKTIMPSFWMNRTLLCFILVWSLRAPRGPSDECVGHGLQWDSIIEYYLLMTHLIKRTKDGLSDVIRLNEGDFWQCSVVTRTHLEVPCSAWHENENAVGWRLKHQ